MTDVLYGINVIVCSIGFVSLMLLMSANSFPKRYLGLMMLGGITVFHSYAYINPDRFYYAWHGWWNLWKLVLGIATVYALWIFLPQPQRDYNTYVVGVLLVSVLYIIPESIVPALNEAVHMAWAASATVLTIGEEPGYIMGDIVIPSILVASSLTGMGLIANKYLY